MHTDLLDQFKRIRAFQANGERAPHKPLLILYAISRLEAGEEIIEFDAALESLVELFDQFGPPRKPSPEHPFTRLANDAKGLLWSVEGQGQLDTLRTFSQKQLVERKVRAGFTDAVKQALKDEQFKSSLISYLLESNFPESIQDDILDYLNLTIGPEEARANTRTKRIRDPHFRRKVLDAYERTCAICGHQVRRGDTIVGLEAAHIKWHQAGGPDRVENGIAMCAMHHKLFDYGLFGIDTNLRVQVSTLANGNQGLDEWLMRYHDKGIPPPVKRVFYPEEEFTVWQFKEVFKGDWRD